MIISASRRTDIPAYYADWFFNRLEAGFVYVRNPVVPQRIRIVSLEPSAVDCIVFWSKNPRPLLDRLNRLERFPFYIQFTLNAYEGDVEAALPAKQDITDTFLRLAERAGPARVLWRYDPILLNAKYTVDYHLDQFEKTACALKGYTQKVIFSFIDTYKKMARNTAHLNIQSITGTQKDILACHIANIARANGFSAETCAEDIDVSKYGISAARCIDNRLIAALTGVDVPYKKDKNQRLACGCASSADIGAYHSCLNGCAYCYATANQKTAEARYLKHNPLSPFMIGDV